MYSYLDEEDQDKLAGYKPETISYLKNKYPDQFPKKELVGPPKELAPVDPRVEAQKQYDEQLDRSNTGSLISNIGDVIAGKQVGSNNKFFQDQNALVKENTIGKLDADRKRKMEDATFKRESDKHDINSDQNVSLRIFLDKYQPSLRKQLGPNFDKLTVEQFPVYQKKLESDRDFNLKVQQLAQEAALKREEMGRKSKEEVKKSSPEERLKNLSGTDKARYDNALMVLKGIDDMGQALDSGDDTFSLWGDSPYTAASRRATEGYGRMQSGGAINKDEEARFERTLPRVTDDAGVQRDKLINQRKEMLSRLNTLGFTPEQIGYQPKEFKYGAPSAPALGYEKNGYRFKGGDPSDQNNWEKL